MINDNPEHPDNQRLSCETVRPGRFSCLRQCLQRTVTVLLAALPLIAGLAQVSEPVAVTAAQSGYETAGPPRARLQPPSFSTAPDEITASDAALIRPVADSAVTGSADAGPTKPLKVQAPVPRSLIASPVSAGTASAGRLTATPTSVGREQRTWYSQTSGQADFREASVANAAPALISAPPAFGSSRYPAHPIHFAPLTDSGSPIHSAPDAAERSAAVPPDIEASTGTAPAVVGDLSNTPDPQPATLVGGHQGHSVFLPHPGMSQFRATVESDAAAWMSPYQQRANQADENTVLSVEIPSIPEVPSDFSPWWHVAVRTQTGFADTALPVDISTLLQDAMLYSPQVLAIKTEPEVQYRVIGQEVARFDWTMFLEGKYNDLNDPVGNELTLGLPGQDRLLVEKANFSSGLRRRNLHGGEFRVAQKLGHETQNSRFFVPPHQATSRMELSYRQPLLDGAGRAVNQSEIVLARIAANASEDDVVQALQDHLLKVTETYWALYRARAEFFQRQKLLQSSEQVLRKLEGRNQVDTVPRQILRAKAAVAQAQSRIQRSFARVRDAESHLRLLVNSPEMLNVGQTEILPMEFPTLISDPSPLRDSLHTALLHRPDISEAIRKMRAAGVRLGVSQNELLPQLDFLVSAYVADLEGNDALARAYRDQFRDNRPGYTVGLEFEVPLGNRAARSRVEQRQWELKRSINVFRATVEKSLTDVEISRREVATAYSEIQSRYQAMSAARTEAEYLQDRFDVLPMIEDSATLLLEDLLDAYERVAEEEVAFAQAMSDHAVAIVRLRKEQGTLLRSRHAQPEIPAGEQEWVRARLESAIDVLPQTEAAGNESLPAVPDSPNDAELPAAAPSLPSLSISAGRYEGHSLR